jgi:ABC-type lipoprotein export system ATPase subunit
MDTITILGGRGRDGASEALDITLSRGDILSVVGPTGSGKSRLLEDIAALACGDTPTGRRVLIDGRLASERGGGTAAHGIVAALSQDMRFVMDATAGEFVLMHAASRGLPADGLPHGVIDCANRITGEAIDANTPLTRLSGGQSRALMIADTAILCAAPVVLVDELENAGVDRAAALGLLSSRDKILIVSTHDPALALMGGRRVCLRRGRVWRVIETTPAERTGRKALERVNERLLSLRTMLRDGRTLDFDLSEYFSHANTED